MLTDFQNFVIAKSVSRHTLSICPSTSGIKKNIKYVANMKENANKTALDIPFFSVVYIRYLCEIFELEKLENCSSQNFLSNEEN